MKAIVVFGAGGPRRPIDRFLKAGFHHCWVCLLDGNVWVLADGVGGIPKLRALCFDRFDLAGYYRSRGYAVIETRQRARAILSPMVARSCVGMVKALLCMRAPLIWTPWQLYRYLQKD